MSRRKRPVWNEPEVLVKEIPGYENYCASADGRIWSKSRFSLSASRRFIQGHWLCPIPLRQRGVLNYTVHLHDMDGRPCKRRIAWCVLSAWLGLPKAGEVSVRRNDDPADNSIGNLRWGNRHECAEKALPHCRHIKLRAHHVEQAKYLRYVCGWPWWRVCGAIHISDSALHAVVSHRNRCPIERRSPHAK